MPETITSHTSGPWVEEIDPDYPDQPSGWIVGVVEYAGCGSHEAKWTSEANKRLALSAPDLLEALKGLLPHFDGVCDEGPWEEGRGWKSDALLAAISHAETAIADATGYPDAQ